MEVTFFSKFKKCAKFLLIVYCYFNKNYKFIKETKYMFLKKKKITVILNHDIFVTNLLLFKDENYMKHNLLITCV